MFVYLGFWNTIKRKFVVIGTPLSRFERKKIQPKAHRFRLQKGHNRHSLPIILTDQKCFYFSLIFTLLYREKTTFRAKNRGK